MACNISTGIGRPDCPGETPGAYDTFYLFNRGQVASFTAGTGNIVSDIVFTGGAGYYQVVAKKSSVVGRSELQDNDNAAADFTHEVDFHLADLSPEARDFVDSLNGANLGVIVRTKGDRFLLFGYTEGLEMRVNNMTTESDGLGYFTTLRGTEVNEPPRIFFDTDATTTLGNITPNIVGS